MNNHKIKILLFIGILIISFGFYYLAEAAAPSIYVSPATLSKNVGEAFDISVGVNPSGNKVCVVEGKLILNKLSCQNIVMADGVMVQSSPSCNNLYFLLGIPGCTTNNKTLFTVSVKAGSAGTATANFSGVDIIGEGVSISSASAGGNYTLISPPAPTCSCTTWSSWLSETCGGGGCISTQRLQTRTRTCTPAGCDIESESQCIEDASCLPVEKKVTPPKEVVPPEVVPPEKKVVTFPPEVKIPEESLASILATSLSISGGEISKSAFLIIVLILCLIELVLIGAREWRLFLGKRKK